MVHESEGPVAGFASQNWVLLHMVSAIRRVRFL